LAQENQNTGRITQLDHINGKMTLQHAPAGTVGAVGASSLVDEYKIQDGLAKDLHAGDEVDFTAAQIGGVLTITKIQKKYSRANFSLRLRPLIRGPIVQPKIHQIGQIGFVIASEGRRR
jgi:Cu/Ag efflux protein CusF